VVDVRAATHRNTLQHTVTRCNTLQYTATHVNMTLRYIGAVGVAGG